MTSRDLSSRDNPFVGGKLIGGNTVTIDELPDHRIIARHSRRAHGLLLMFATLGGAFPTLLIANDYWRWFDAHPLGWFRLGLGCMIVVTLFFVIDHFFFPRYVSCNPADETLRYHISGFTATEFVIPFSEIDSAEIMTTAYIQTGGGDNSTWEEIPMSSVKDYHTPTYRYTVLCKLRTGMQTFPITTGVCEIANMFASRLSSLIADSEAKVAR